VQLCNASGDEFCWRVVENYEQRGNNMGHEVMATGCSTSTPFGVYYFDPQLGTYRQTSSNNLISPYVVQRLNNH